MGDTLLLTMEEAAAELRVCKRHAYRMAQRGELPTVKLGHSRRVRREDLERYVEALDGR